MNGLFSPVPAGLITPVTSGSGGSPALTLNFLSGVLDPRLTFTRGSSATYFDATGTLQSAASNVPRFDYGPTPNGLLGLLMEEQRTNGVRNNTMQGAVAGTPGTLPTYWSMNGMGTLNYSVIGTGTESGIAYCDIRVYGTTSTTSCYIEPEAVGIIAATQGQAWALSSYVRIVGGSASNINSFNLVIGETASGSYKTQGNKPFTPSTSLLATQRTVNAYTVQNAATDHIYPFLLISFASGVAIDITLRIGLPQLEQGGFATYPIPTSGSAATRSYDGCYLTNAPASYQLGLGTLFMSGATEMPIPATESCYAAGISDLSTNNRVGLRLGSGSSAPSLLLDVSATANSVTGPLNAATGTPFTLIGAWKNGGQSVAMNGSSIIETGANAVPTGSAYSFTIGGYANGSQLGPWNGWIAEIKYWQRYLSNADLLEAV